MSPTSTIDRQRERQRVKRESWRVNDLDRRNRRLSRSLWRAIWLAVVLLLLFCLWRLLFDPFRHPDTYLFFLSGNDYGPLIAQPVDFVDGELAYFEKLSPALARDRDGQPQLIRGNLDSPSTVSQYFGQLRNLGIDRGDSLILYLRGRAVIRDSQTFILCENAELSALQDGTYSLTEILQALRTCRAGSKLLVLDVYQDEDDPRLGVFPSRLRRTLQQELADHRDPRLWVLHACSELETSKTSTAVRQSVLGFMLAHGLLGSADADGDRVIRLDELYDYVRHNVAEWTYRTTKGASVQNPKLQYCGDELPQPPVPVLLSISALPPELHPEDFDVGLAATQSMAAKADTPATREGQALGTPQVPFGQLEPALPTSPASSAIPSASTLGRGTGGAEEAPPPAAQTPPVDEGTGERSVAEDQGKSLPAAADNGSAESSADEEQTRITETGAASVAVSPGEVERLNAVVTADSAQLLESLWSSHDHLMRDSDWRRRPLDYAPTVWGELERELHWFESILLDGNPSSPTEFHLALRRLAYRLTLLTTGQEYEVRRPWSVVDRIIQQQPQAVAIAENASSFALAKRFAVLSRQPMDASPQKDYTALEQALAAATDADFLKWLQESWRPEYEPYSEFAYAHQLGVERGGAPWTLVQLAVTTRILGERVATREGCLEPWLTHDIEQADLVRLQGERMIADRIDPQWPAYATAKLRNATTRYRRAEQQFRDICAAIQLRNELLHDVRDYIQVWYASEEDRRTATISYNELEQLIAVLRKLHEGLKRPQPNSAEQVLLWADEARLLRQRLEEGWRLESLQRFSQQNLTAGDGWRIGLLLRTSLLPAASRSELIASRPVADARALTDFTLDSPAEFALPRDSISRKKWRRVGRRISLEYRLCQLADFCTTVDNRPSGLATTSRIDNVVKSAVSPLTDLSFVPTDESWDDYLQSVRELANFHAQHPQYLTRMVRENVELYDSRERPRQLAILRAAFHDLHLLDPRDSLQVEQLQLPQRILNAALYDLLIWHRRRLDLARQDTVDSTARTLSLSMSQYRQLAMQIPAQPEVPEAGLTPIRIDGPTSISLTTEPDAEVPLSIQLGGESPEPVWIVLAYNHELLDVASDGVKGVLDDAQLREEIQLSDASRQSLRQISYPDYLQETALEQSLLLEPGAGRRMRLKIHRRGRARGRTKLIVKVISSSSFIRHEVSVRMRSEKTLRLLTDARPGDWEETDEGIEIFTLPNRQQPFRFQLAHDGGQTRRFRIDLSIPTQLPDALEYEALLTEEESKTYLEEFGVLESVLHTAELELPPGQPVTIPLAEVPTSGASPDQAQGAGDSPTTTKQLLPHGLLLMITDLTNRECTFRRIEFAAQRPHRFARPRVDYNAQSEKIELTVRPSSPDIVPAEGIPVSMEIPDGIGLGRATRLEATITAPDYVARLFAYVPKLDRRTVTVHVAVANYPRAFTYRVPCYSTQLNVPELTDRTSVRVISPPNGELIDAPAEFVPVELQVDAPPGAFPHRRSRDFVELGLDINRDRVFLGESPIRLPSDRQVSVEALQLKPDGTALIKTQLTDFRLRLPTVGIRNTRSNVLARLSVAGSTTWSNAVEVVFDADPPEIQRVELLPGRMIEKEEEIRIAAWPNDGGLSGIARVEVAVDSDGTGEFSEQNQPRPAKLVGASRWQATLKAKELASGRHTLLIRAIDRAGNVGVPQRVAFEVFDRDSELVASQLRNSVSGILRYGRVPLASADVILELAECDKQVRSVQTRPNGSFLLQEVPPGKYRIRARGLARNGYRKAEQEFSVLPLPGPPTQLGIMQAR